MRVTSATTEPVESSEAGAIAPTSDLLHYGRSIGSGSKWIASGQWVPGEAEEEVELHFHSAPESLSRSPDGVCQVTLKGLEVGMQFVVFDTLFDAEQRRILFSRLDTVANADRAPALAIGILESSDVLKLNGAFDLPRYTLEIDASFARRSDAQND